MTTTLRDRIATTIRQALCAEPLHHDFGEAADAIWALFSDPEPPSDEELACLIIGAHRVALMKPGTDSNTHGLALARRLYDLGHARGLATRELEIAELQRRLEVREVELAVARQERDGLQRKYDSDLRGWVDGQKQIAEDHARAKTRADQAEARLKLEQHVVGARLKEIGEVLTWLACTASTLDDAQVWYWLNGERSAVAHNGTPGGIISALLSAHRASQARGG